jgi:hypothetical protein
LAVCTAALFENRHDTGLVAPQRICDRDRRSASGKPRRALRWSPEISLLAGKKQRIFGYFASLAAT